MEISEIKSRLNITQVLTYYHLKADKNGRVCCPFHNDKTPSLQIYPKTNTWTCFSANCTAGSGDVIDFIMKYEKLGKHEAILRAQNLAGLPNEIKPNTKVEIIHTKPELSQQQRTEILTEAFTHFARSMNAKPEKAINYLASRKLDYKKLSIGYDAGTLHKMKETTKEQKENYLQSGLIKPDKFGRENSYYTRFNGCIIFPLFDKANNIVSLYGRHCEKREHHYLEGDHQGLYPNYPKTETTQLLLSEAIIDAATLLQLPEITKQFSILALYGTNGFTEEHKQAIVALKQLNEVTLFFDGDEAGKEALRQIAEELKKIHANLIITSVETPEGEDVNSLSLGHEPEIFTHLLETRKPLFVSTENKLIEKEKIASVTPVENNPIAENRLKIEPDCLRYETPHLQITLWGGIEIHAVNRLRATLHLQLKTNEYRNFRDTADLYSHSQTDRFIKQAAEKLEISSVIVSEALTGLTKELEHYRGQKREEKRKSEENREHQNIDRFSPTQTQKASEFLHTKNLTEKTYAIFNELGIIGERDNAALLFFIFLTRFFKNPLHAIVMGSSGSGKTHLLKGVADTVPKQHIHFTTSLSENTLYYTPKEFLKHKILLQEDLDGAYNALLPLRELMSNQSISRFSTKTNSRTGDSKQVYLHVEGPVCVAGATTKDKIYEDNANRSFLIQIEENPKHEAEVLEYQGKAAAGLVNFKKHEENIQLLKVAQLLIEPHEVLIPFATKLELPPHVFKKLRTKNHYLTLIKSVTLWNQKQRKRTTGAEGTPYLLSTLEDVRWANILCKESLLRKSDELNGKTRHFFESLKDYLKQRQASVTLSASEGFYAKEIRRHYRMHPFELQRRLNELEARGLIRCVNRSNKPGNEYEITVWNDYEQLKSGMDILDVTLQKLVLSEVVQNGAQGRKPEPSQYLHTTFTSPVVKVEIPV